MITPTMIKIKINDDIIEMTIEEARRIYNELFSMFGNNQLNQFPNRDGIYPPFMPWSLPQNILCPDSVPIIPQPYKPYEVICG